MPTKARPWADVWVGGLRGRVRVGWTEDRRLRPAECGYRDRDTGHSPVNIAARPVEDALNTLNTQLHGPALQ